MNGLIKQKSLGRIGIQCIQFLAELFFLLGLVLLEQTNGDHRLMVCFSASSLVGMCLYITGKPGAFSLLPLFLSSIISSPLTFTSADAGVVQMVLLTLRILENVQFNFRPKSFNLNFK